MKVLKYEFVEFIPDKLASNTVYISVAFATVAHRCCCGCGNEVVTPLSPTDWQLTFDGESVSLYPSIGNWSFPCQSHYWIVRNGIRWAEQWSEEKIAAGRARDEVVRTLKYGNSELTERVPKQPPVPDDPKAVKAKLTRIQRMKKWLLW